MTFLCHHHISQFHCFATITQVKEESNKQENNLKKKNKKMQTTASQLLCTSKISLELEIKS